MVGERDESSPSDSIERIIESGRERRISNMFKNGFFVRLARLRGQDTGETGSVDKSSGADGSEELDRRTITELLAQQDYKGLSSYTGLEKKTLKRYKNANPKNVADIIRRRQNLKNWT